MTEPTRQDALDAAEVFYTALNTVLYYAEKERVGSSVVAEHAASLKAAVLSTSVAQQMDVDTEGVQRVCLHMAKKHLEGQDRTELLDRMLEQLKGSDHMKN
ncbi:MAG: hypothetical protein V5A84_04285 [Planctomycetota bacterium]